MKRDQNICGKQADGVKEGGGSRILARRGADRAGKAKLKATLSLPHLQLDSTSIDISD